jgi:hypothetical protein
LDKEYTERLLSYVRMSEYRALVQIVWYTNEDYCRSMMTEENKPEVLLLDTANQENESQPLLLQKGCPVAMLGDGTAFVPHDATMLEKYQPLNRLLDAVLQLAGRPTDGSRKKASGKNGCYILGVYSASGGAGKTVFAYTAAGVLSRMGIRPLVLTLESIPSLCWNAAGEDRFGKAMYRVAGGSAEGDPGLGPELVEDAYRKIRFLPGASNLEELEEMDKEDSLKLIRRASQTLGVDAVIVDLDSSLHPRILGALLACHRIACLIPDQCIAREKAERQLPRLMEAVPGIRDKLSAILNISSGHPQEWHGGGFEIEEILPCQEDWRTLSDFRQLGVSALYESRLQKWLLSVMEPPAGWAGARRHG